MKTAILRILHFQTIKYNQRSLESQDELFVFDIGHDGELVGIEVLSLSRLYGKYAQCSNVKDEILTTLLAIRNRMSHRGTVLRRDLVTARELIIQPGGMLAKLSGLRRA